MGQKFLFQGKEYDSDEYRVAYDGGEQRLIKKDSALDRDLNSGGVNIDHRTQDTQKAQERKENWNKIKQGVGNTLQGAGRAAAYAGINTAKAQGINDPNQGHFDRAAALAESQAAANRADAQTARQEAYRNSGDRALTESAKMAEASSAANIRNNQKAMSAEMGGAAATMAAQKNASVDPMQNAMALKNAGYNRQDRATQLGQEATTYQTSAEDLRKDATVSQEATKEKAVQRAEAERASQAQAERDEYDRNLQNQKTNVENAQNQLNTTQNLKAKDKLDYMLNTNNTDQASMTNLFWAWNEYAKEDGSAAEEYMSNIIIPRIGKGSDAAHYIYSAWQRANQGTPNYDNANRIMYDKLISDERMKNILSPAGKALFHLYKGRTR